MSRRGEEWNRWRYARTWPVQKAAAREQSRRTLEPMPRGRAREHVVAGSGSDPLLRWSLRCRVNTSPATSTTQMASTLGRLSLTSQSSDKRHPWGRRLGRTALPRRLDHALSTPVGGHGRGGRRARVADGPAAACV